VQDVPPIVEVLAQTFMPGPITFLLNKQSIVPDLVTAGSAKVAVRIPQHPLTLSLLQQLNFPLAAPSANVFGYISPTTAQHVYEGLSGNIPYILDGGAAGVGVESTIIGFNADGSIILHRSGGITIEAIEAITKQKIKVKVGVESRPETPGQLKSHYAPHIPLYRGNVPELLQQFSHKQIALLSFSNGYNNHEVAYKMVLSPEGNLHEAAAQLFGALRHLDKLDVDVIITEIFPDEGIGKAINDRLNRAQVAFKL
jgi:L-threonylcarbamoyladenylate synthase